MMKLIFDEVLLKNVVFQGKVNIGNKAISNVIMCPYFEGKNTCAHGVWLYFQAAIFHSHFSCSVFTLAFKRGDKTLADIIYPGLAFF